LTHYTGQFVDDTPNTGAPNMPL